MEVRPVLGGTQIAVAPDDNLDDYINVGNYRCTTNNIGQTIKNSPVLSAFSLFVLPFFGNDRYIHVLFSSAGIYYRFKQINNWTSWLMIATQE